MPLTPVSLADTFDVWRIRTNQIITSLDSAESNVANITTLTTVVNVASQAAFAKANAANYFAYLVNANTVAAFSYANSSYINLSTVITAAFDKANTGDTTGSSAFDKANAANVLAYSSGLTGAAAFDAANTIGGAAFNAANAANIVGGAAFDKANTAGGGYYRGNNGDKGLTSNKNDLFRINNDYVSQNLYFSAGENACATGPLTVNTGFVIQVNAGARVVIV